MSDVDCIHLCLSFQSSEKLRSINETISAFKARSNLPYIQTARKASTKRLNFENPELSSQK